MKDTWGGEPTQTQAEHVNSHRKVDISNLERGVKALWDGEVTEIWHLPSFPFLGITRLNQGTFCLTPDTSDLCHLICGASKWQRGKGAETLPEGLVVSEYEQWALTQF